MSRATVIDGDRGVEVDATAQGDTLLVSPEDLELATGWVLKPEGLCRGAVCVPVRDTALRVDDRLDLRVVADALGRPLAFEPDPPVAVLGDAADDVADAMQELTAPAFTLPDVDGNPVSLADFAGRKKLIVTWASWCGCRWDLPVWQQIQAELEPHGFTVLSIALDEAEGARLGVDESTAPLTYPVLVDEHHRVAELYGIINVPSTVWIDEDDHIVRPPAIAPADDTFKDFTKIEAEVHHDALRRWVVDGEAPLTDDAVRERQKLPTPEVQAARAERRLAAQLHRDGRNDAAARHFARAMDLAPDDWTINRGSMPLRGEDPFGQAFFDFYQSWEAKGRPGYES